MWKLTLFLSSLVPQLLASVVNFDSEIGNIELNILKKQLLFGSCDTTESINLSGMDITKIPSKFVKSKAIKSINLDDNLISEIPDTTCEVIPNLQCLNLAKNRIPFDQIMNFKHCNLRTLILDYQNKTSEADDMTIKSFTLPASRADYSYLENLHLNGIYFEQFPAHFQSMFPRLTSLYLADNSIEWITSDIFSVLPSSLTSLHLERNNIKYLQLTNLGSIEALYLDNNPFLNFDVVYNDNRVKLLSLSGCGQSNVDFLKYFHHLVSLDLSSNFISDMRITIFTSIPYLENLSLANNHLSYFPDLTGLRNLSALSLRYNDIASIPGVIQLHTLKKLDLRGNRIASVDVAAFAQMFRLEELDLSENMLSQLPPDWATSLTKLTHLNLRDNRFSNIADMWLGSLISLRELYVKGNSLTTINHQEYLLFPPQCTVYVL